LAALVACTSTGTVNCGGCPGDYLDPNGVIRAGDAVASVRVCIDGTCRTQRYTYDDPPERYPLVTGTDPPNRARIDELAVTTFDVDQKPIRTVYGRSLALPVVKAPPKDSCACTGLRITYDDAAGRFVVTTQ
jgi:hypothetical protein